MKRSRDYRTVLLQKVKRLIITPSVLNYNSFAFFVPRLAVSSYLFFLKNLKKIKAIFKIYYMLNNIITKINNNYYFLIRQDNQT
jgi:hypothetical protein